MNQEWIRPGNADYDTLKNSLNAAGEPAVIARCREPAEVAVALAYAKTLDLTVSVRGGGHGFHGKSTNRGGLVIDLGLMNAMTLDGDVIRVGAGARWGDVAAFLEPHGLALTSGDTKQVGVAGLTLGGGIGWMVRRYGLTIDSLLAAEVVTADGRVLRAAGNENADLFWALRGGTGNFGVVTAFEFRTQRVESVFRFEITYGLEHRAALVERWGKFMRTAPDELSSSLTLFPGIAPFRPEPELRISSCFAGAEDEAHQCYEALCALAPTLSTNFARIPYAAMLHDAPPRNPAFRALNRSAFVPRVDAAFAAAVAEHAGSAGKPITQIRALGGAMNRVAADATAFAHRGAEALLITASLAPAATADEQTQQILEAMGRPYAALTTGAYLNFHNDTSPSAIETIYPPATLAKLRDVKRRYDPDNVFRQTHAVGGKDGK
jgi:FAD/FMN-containing dehydrogenase